MAAAQRAYDGGHAVHVNELAGGVYGSDVGSACVLGNDLDLASSKHASGIVDVRSGKHHPLVHQRAELGQLAGELHE